MLGDTARLRLLRLLAREKLNVSELTDILAMAQSGISRNLRLLKEAGLVTERRESGWAFYSLDPETYTQALRELWPLLRHQLTTLTEAREDDARLEEVLRQRREDFRETTQRGGCPGRSWAAWARTLSYLVPTLTVADLGCGEGTLTLEVARWARKVIAVDHSREMLRKAKALAKKRRITNVIWQLSEIEEAPLKDDSAQVVLMAQVLHSVKDPLVALRQARRILAPGGTLLIQELKTHQEEWVKDRLGDVRLGFEQKELVGLLKQASFTDVRIDVGARRRGDPFTVLIGAGRKSK